MKIRNIRYWILIADLLWSFAALGIAIGLRYSGVRGEINFTAHFRDYFPTIITTVGIWVFVYFEMSLDGFKGGWHLPAISSRLIVAVSLLMTGVLAFAFVSRHYYSRLILFYFALSFVLGLVGVRCLACFLVTSQVKHLDDHRSVILGNGRLARELADKIASHPELPFHIVGFLCPGELEASNGYSRSLATPFVSLKTLQVLDLLAQERVRKLIVAMSQPNGMDVQKLIAECRKSSMQVYLVPQWYNLYVSKTKLIDIDGLPLLSLQERDTLGANSALKRAMDLVLGAGILLFACPVLFIAALFVHYKKGRAFRADLRCGKDGIPFQMYRLNVDRHAVSPKNYERFLVRWSVTELPQLWNVLRGDMSLVGPRPEPADRLESYSDWQRQRLKVPSGVTGLAQVHGLREQHPSEEKAPFDLQYIYGWSPLLDLSLILQTVWTLLFRGLRQEPELAQAARSVSGRADYLSGEALDANRS